MKSSWSSWLLMGISVLIIGRITYSLGIDPLLQKRARIRALGDRVADLERQRTTLTQNSATRDAIASRALAADPMRVAVGYQSWLLKLGNDLGISDLSVKPFRPLRFHDIGHRIPLAIRANTDSERIGQLVDRIEQSNGLHTLRHVSMETAPNGDVTANMVLDAVAMSSSQPAASQTQAANLDSPIIHSELGQHFADRRPFERYVEPERVPVKPPEPVIVAEEPPPVITKMVAVNHFKGVRFVGTWSTNGQRKALFVGPESADGYTVPERTMLAIGDQSCLIEEVGRDFVSVRFGKELQRVEIGELVVASAAEVH